MSLYACSNSGGHNICKGVFNTSCLALRTGQCQVPSPSILAFHVCQIFSPVTSHKPFFMLSYTSTTCAHCILDKTYAHTMHTGVHRPPPSRLACHLQHSSGSLPSNDHHLSSYTHLYNLCYMNLSYTYIHM